MSKRKQVLWCDLMTGIRHNGNVHISAVNKEIGRRIRKNILYLHDTFISVTKQNSFYGKKNPYAVIFLQHH